MLGFILGFWAVLPLVRGYPGSVMGELPLIAWVLRLVNPTISELQLTKNIFQGGKVIVQELYDGLGVLIPQREVFTGQRR